MIRRDATRAQAIGDDLDCVDGTSLDRSPPPFCLHRLFLLAWPGDEFAAFGAHI
jgi:hypothetical protein